MLLVRSVEGCFLFHVTSSSVSSTFLKNGTELLLLFDQSSHEANVFMMSVHDPHARDAGVQESVAFSFVDKQ